MIRVSVSEMRDSLDLLIWCVERGMGSAFVFIDVLIHFGGPKASGVQQNQQVWLA